MNSPDACSRRDALKTLGAGAVLLGLGTLATKVRGAEAVGSTPSILPQPFRLPKLGYGYDALEPHVDARTMEIHHTKHHQTYIDNANKALAEYPDLGNLSATDILRNLNAVPEKIRLTLRNNVGGHLNHTLFWRTIGPASNSGPTAKLAAALDESFGSLDKFKSQFGEAATKRFGSGWAWLVAKGGALSVVSTANQDSPVSEGAVPLLGLDVWEHAYYLKYQNRRAEYIAAFWNVVNWPEVTANHAEAIKS